MESGSPIASGSMLQMITTLSIDHITSNSNSFSPNGLLSQNLVNGAL